MRAHENIHPSIRAAARTWWARIGGLLFLIQPIWFFAKWLTGSNSVGDFWEQIDDFVVTWPAALLFLLSAFALISVGYYRAFKAATTPLPNDDQEIEFPTCLIATYLDTEFHLNGFEDFVVYRFKLTNPSPWDLEIEGRVDGTISIRLGGSQYPYFSPCTLADNGKIQAEDSDFELRLAQPLTLEMGTEYAYGQQRGRNVKLNFGNLGLVFKGSEGQKGRIEMPDGVEVHPQESFVHWPRYMKAYALLHDKK